MKRIDNMAEEALKERSAEYISEKEKKRFGRDILNLTATLVCLAAGLAHGRLYPEQDVVTGLIYLLGVFIIGMPVIVTAVKGFLQKNIGASMEILVSIALIVAVLDSQYVLAILIPVILTLVHFMEEKSIMGGRDAIEGLKKMQSNMAIQLKNGIEEEVDARLLVPGDVIVVKPGMALPIDGAVLKGVSSIDQKSLTGESLPKEVGEGDKVFAGTMNMEGVLTVLVEKAFSDTSFQMIVKLLEESEKITIPEIRIIDRFMIYYIPLALVIATMVWIFSQDVSRAIAILVVSCPCGYMLVSSAPMIAALAQATRRGVLIKNAAFVEKLADVDHVIFDKTGTLTTGMLMPENYYLEKADTFEEMLACAAAVAHHSLHPVSKSLMKLAEGLEYRKDLEVREHMGKGVEGACEDERIIIGNYRWIKSMGFDISDEYEQDGAVSWVVRNGAVMGCIQMRDTPRADAREAIKELRNMGISHTSMLTGDNRRATARIQEAVGVSSVFSELLPEEKLRIVKECRSHSIVAVVGDGINDALALAEADIGIAMGAMGSDTAIQSADISLMNNSLGNIPFMIALAGKTRDIIYQNIIIAFLMSFVMIFLASSGVIGALAGAFLHNAGAFVILVNSGRILQKNQS